MTQCFAAPCASARGVRCALRLWLRHRMGDPHRSLSRPVKAAQVSLPHRAEWLGLCLIHVYFLVSFVRRLAFFKYYFLEKNLVLICACVLKAASCPCSWTLRVNFFFQFVQT